MVPNQPSQTAGGPDPQPQGVEPKRFGLAAGVGYVGAPCSLQVGDTASRDVDDWGTNLCKGLRSMELVQRGRGSTKSEAGIPNSSSCVWINNIGRQLHARPGLSMRDRFRKKTNWVCFHHGRLAKLFTHRFGRCHGVLVLVCLIASCADVWPAQIVVAFHISRCRIPCHATCALSGALSMTAWRVLYVIPLLVYAS